MNNFIQFCKCYLVFLQDINDKIKKMKMIKRTLVMVFAATLFINCGSDKKKEEKTETVTKQEVKKEIPKEKKLGISGNDLMKFNKSKLTVFEGQKVILTLNHTGKMAAKSMGHNIVILQQGVDVSGFAMKAIAASETGYVPQDALADVVAYTKVIGGGESTTIEFDAPAAGTYDFICSFPGHYALMKGKFIVKKN